MTDIWYYRELDYPQMPEQLITAALDLLPDLEVESKSYGHLSNINKLQNFNKNFQHMSLKRHMNIDGKKILHAPNLGVDLNAETENWARANIAEEFLHIQISWTPKNRKMSGAHSDATRNYTMLYLLDTGGDDVITSFYQEKNQPVQRLNKTFVDDYDNLIKLAEIKVKPRTWTILNSTILHGVENIQHPRVAIQIGFDKFNQKIN
jgi:hypothetical protein